MSSLPPRDPFRDEHGAFDTLADGQRLMVALVEAALAPDLTPFANAIGAMDDADVRSAVIAQALSLANGILNDREARRADTRGRLRRALDAFREEWSR